MRQHEDIQSRQQTSDAVKLGLLRLYALLVHGWSSFALRFSPWVAGLRAAGYAVVTFDQPGHGYSTGGLCTLRDFVDTIRAVGRRYGNPTVAVGHSLGAAALTLAQSEEWHADRLVVIAPPAESTQLLPSCVERASANGLLDHPIFRSDSPDGRVFRCR